ncbi:hypothetical protein MNBD_NITROSPINAE03-1236 [hydrothermal vent metagenome]|uniref:Uncharacterized protein n=1 Tax=hydrothermal vent metagenome TaxID=652676 RepID=A0A3B1CEZ4_9ZZZZ
MFIGHYGVALAAKKVAPQTSLGALFFAAQFIDLLWPFFLLSGIEIVRIDPGNTKFTPLDFVSYPYSHSLAMVIVWGAAVGGGYFALRRSRNGALALGALVLSHWILDLITHRPDLQLAPGSEIRVGFGLWDFVVASVALEFAIFAVGLFLYTRTMKAKDKTGRFALWGLVAFLLITWAGAIFGPPPPSVTMVAFPALLLWLLIPWAIWIDRHRSASV